MVSPACPLACVHACICICMHVTRSFETGQKCIDRKKSRVSLERISAGGGGWDDDGGDEQCATPPAPPSFSLMMGEAAMKRVTAPWRWWGGCVERRRAVRAAGVAAAVLLAVVVLSYYGSWGGDHDEMPASLFTTRGSENATPANLTDDQLLGGLLTAAFSPQSCRSRYEFAGYHKRKPAHTPSPYLVAKLRKHEALQKRCGPGTAPYEKALRQLKFGDGAAAAAGDDDCRYLVSISYNRGLGNRIIAIVSAFLYAVLTERALLVAPYNGDVAALFCEPFPATTWLLPDGRRFPLRHLPDLNGKSKESLGALLKNNVISVAAGVNGTSSWSGGRPPPPYVYLHLDGGADYHDKLFYCDEQQRLLRGVPWLLMKTDSYLVPGLFLVPSLRGELERMFPEKDAVFHHLSRYLLHPANAVWHAITAYHSDHLAGAGHLVGIQIRVYHKETPPVSQVALDQVLSCARREKLLPASSGTMTNTSSSDQAVLVTSLSSWYYEKIRDEVGGGVHQPSHEGLQRMGDTAHDMRALSEMFLLSTCDALLTTGFSTFGYVAQGLAGVRPWIMPRRPWWEKEAATVVPDPPCARVATPEPCFHSPSYYDCAARRNYDDIGKELPYVRRCEDVSWGIQLVNGSSQSQW
uniref:Fucosyltransferase n=1 Tax=Oryza punctata TaxID=4537 RepID=A0A0E0JYE9_ORYPU